MSRKPLAALVAGVALCGAAAIASAQSTDQLVQKYEPLVGGSEQQAKQLITGLSKGGDFKVGDTTIDNSNGKLGNGEINIALALTEASLSKDSKLTLETALEKVLQDRASGMGWGRIANEMGFRLGDLVRSDKAQGRDEIARTQTAGPASMRPDKPPRIEKFDRPERPERPEKPERAGRGR